MAEATEIILNPKGHLYRDGRTWIMSQRDFLRRLAPAEVTVAETAEEASQIARQSALKGYGRIISAGGSDIAYGVVNGLMSLTESHRHSLKVGFLSLTRPDLWSRTLQLPRDLNRQLDILSAGHTLPFDVGRVECRDDEDRPMVRYFLNGATFGITGLVRREWRDPDSHLVETIRRIAAAMPKAVGPVNTRIRMESQGVTLFDGPCALAMVMGGRFYPGLGQVAPQANPADGLLDLAWVETSSLWTLIRNLSALVLHHPRQRGRASWQSLERLEVRVEKGTPVYLELDGEPTGRLPAVFSMEYRALPVIVEPVPVRIREPQRAVKEKLVRGRLVGNIRADHFGRAQGM